MFSCVLFRIGWAHGGTRILNVNKYEQARPYRKSQKGMVLTREEREEILLNWGASFHDIIESIRTNIRVKNQRRQTVTNLGKVQRLEEAFESATRKLKRTLLLRRRTGEKVKELQNQANLASSALTSLMIAEDNVLNDIRADVAPTGHEPEQDDLENLVEVNVSDFCRKSPLETKLHRLPSNISENDASTISGFTLGNSTTASVLEMEKFYRDLELEMFGDTDVPDMVGQTLEVPGLEIPEEERVYTEPPAVPCYPVDDGSFIFQSAPVSNGRTPNGMDHSDALHHHIHDVQGRSMLSRSLDDYDCCPSGHPPPPYGLYPPQQLPYHVPEGERIPTNYQFANARLSSSWDSPDAMGAQALRSIYALEQQYASAYAPPGPPPSAIGNPRYPPSNGRYEYPRKNGRLRHRSARDGPQIRHLPPPTHLTPTHWMEAHDDSIGARRGYGSEPIIITEESYERGNRNFMGSDQPYVYPASYDAYHNHIHTQQFPPSFY